MASAVNYEPLKRAFEEAGQYKIAEEAKFAETSIFQIKDKGRSMEYLFSNLKKQFPTGCIDSDNKTFQFSKTMSDSQFIFGVLFWGSKFESKKRRESDAKVYSCDVLDLLANLLWIDNEIGNIHRLNNGPGNQ